MGRYKVWMHEERWLKEIGEQESGSGNGSRGDLNMVVKGSLL